MLLKTIICLLAQQTFGTDTTNIAIILSCSVNFYFREITYIMFKRFHLVYVFLCTFTLYYNHNYMIMILYILFIYCIYVEGKELVWFSQNAIA